MHRLFRAANLAVLASRTGAGRTCARLEAASDEFDACLLAWRSDVDCVGAKEAARAADSSVRPACRRLLRTNYRARAAVSPANTISLTFRVCAALRGRNLGRHGLQYCMRTSTIALGVLTGVCATMAVTRARSSRNVSTYALASVAALAGSLGLLRVLTRSRNALKGKKAATLQLREGCLRCGDSQVSVFCMNALAPNLVSKARYKYASDAVLSWRHRFRLLKDLIKTVRSAVPALLCLCIRPWRQKPPSVQQSSALGRARNRGRATAARLAHQALLLQVDADVVCLQEIEVDGCDPWRIE